MALANNGKLRYKASRRCHDIFAIHAVCLRTSHVAGPATVNDDAFHGYE